MNDQIIRNKTRDRYTVVLQSITTDTRLSLKDLGLLVKLLSLPDNWKFSEKGLQKIFVNDGLDSIRTGLKNLEKCGYLRRTKLRNEKGQIVSTHWVIFETPTNETEATETRTGSEVYPRLDFPTLDNPTQYNTNKLNTKKIKERKKERSAEEEKKSESKKKKEQPSRFVPPTLDEVTEYCVAGGKSINPEQFVSYYTSNGWRVGKSPMKNWKAAVRTWELRNRGMEWNRHIAVNQSYERESNYDLEAYEACSIFDNGDLTAKDLERLLKKPAEPLINELISG